MNQSIKRPLSLVMALVLLLSATLAFSAPTAPAQSPEIPEWMKDGSAPPPPPGIPADLEAIANQPRIGRTAPPQAPAGPPPGMRPPPPPGMSRASASAADQRQESMVSGMVAPGVDLNASVGEIKISDMPVNDVLDMIQNFTGKTVLRQNSVTGTFNFHSQGSLSRQQAIEALVSLLALNGVAITPLGDRYLKAVPATSAANHTPELIEGSTLAYGASQEVCSKLFNLDYLVTAEAVLALNSLQSGLVGTSVTAFDKNRSILVTDSLVNLQRMETLLNLIDKPHEGTDKILFFPLRNISATDAQKRCQQMLGGSMGSRFTGNTTVDADDRTNQLIVYTHPANESLIRNLVENLDKDVEPLTRTEMFSIRHADAVELSDIIKQVVTGQEQVRNNTAGTAGNQRAQQVAQAQSVTDSAGTQFSAYLTIVPDERTNNIVATGTPSDLRLMGKIIDQLDALLPQVRIEVVITEVTLSKGDASGLETFGIRLGSTAPTGSLSGDVTSGNGLNNGNKDMWISPGFRGGLDVSPFALENFTMDAVFKVAKTNSKVQVLSAPNIVTTHNREASIIVGSREPVVTTAVTNSGSTANDMVANIDYQDIALELTVKPLIGSNGVIQMEITQKVNEVTDRITLAGLGQQPVIGTRQASSFVSVGNGQMVVLGGLQKVKDTKNDDKVFLLGDIPLLGRLFRPSNKDVTRTELLIFIRPVILANPAEAMADAQKKISELESSKRVEDYLEDGSLREKSKK